MASVSPAPRDVFDELAAATGLSREDLVAALSPGRDRFQSSVSAAPSPRPKPESLGVDPNVVKRGRTDITSDYAAESPDDLLNELFNVLGGGVLAGAAMFRGPKGLRNIGKPPAQGGVGSGGGGTPAQPFRGPRVQETARQEQAEAMANRPIDEIANENVASRIRERQSSPEGKAIRRSAESEYRLVKKGKEQEAQLAIDEGRPGTRRRPLTPEQQERLLKRKEDLEATSKFLEGRESKGRGTGTATELGPPDLTPISDMDLLKQGWRPRSVDTEGSSGPVYPSRIDPTNRATHEGLLSSEYGLTPEVIKEVLDANIARGGNINRMQPPDLTKDYYRGKGAPTPEQLLEIVKAMLAKQGDPQPTAEEISALLAKWQGVYNKWGRSEGEE